MTVRGIVFVFLIVQFSASGYAANIITNEVSENSSEKYENVEGSEGSSDDTTETVETTTTVKFVVPGSSNIYFSDKDPDTDRQFLFKDQKPLTNWPKCGQNEWFYPGDVDGDWVCDCRPGYVFYAQDRNCYKAYQQGPCKDGHILVVSKDHAAPTCVINECGPGFVMFNNECSEFQSEAACLKMLKRPVLGRKMRLEVDPSSHQLACADETNGVTCINKECKIVYNNKIYYNSITA